MLSECYVDAKLSAGEQLLHAAVQQHGGPGTLGSTSAQLWQLCVAGMSGKLGHPSNVPEASPALRSTSLLLRVVSTEYLAQGQSKTCHQTV